MGVILKSLVARGDKTHGSIRGRVSVGSVDRYKVYNGTCEVVPKQAEQVLETQNKYMDDNITVRAIPYAEVTNESGGYTATIGG